MDKILELLKKMPILWKIVCSVLFALLFGILLFFFTTSCGVTVKTQMNADGAVTTTVRQGVDSASVNVHMYNPKK